MNYLSLKKLTIILCFLLFVFASFQCNNDDGTILEPVPITKLSGHHPIAIVPSTFSVNGQVTNANSITPVEDSGRNVYFLQGTDEQDFCQISMGDDFMPDGKENYIGRLDGDQYLGEDLQVLEGVDNITIQGTGRQIVGGNAVDVPIKIVVSESQLGAGESELYIKNNIALLNGDLGIVTYNQILDLNANHPNVHTILFDEVPGSVNDEVNMETGRLIRKAGYRTWAKRKSEVASGGVDLFCAGKKRRIDNGAEFLVHSWCCTDDGKEAGQVPETDQAHQAQITYFNEMLGAPTGKDFYFFTIQSAPFDGEYKMKEEEIAKYKLRMN